MIQIFIHPDESVAMVGGPDVELIFENYHCTVKIIMFENESILNALLYNNNIHDRFLKIVNYDKKH